MPNLGVVVGAQTIVHDSGADPATLILASLGVGLALASLAWQAFSFRISGSRISVEILAGLGGVMGGQRGVATLRPRRNGMSWTWCAPRASANRSRRARLQHRARRNVCCRGGRPLR